MKQQILFEQGHKDGEDICRRKHGGNQESVEAHRHTPKEERYQRILDLLTLAGEHGLTLDELSQRLSVHPNQISGRVTELRVAQRIVKTDRRRQTQTGSWAAVYMKALT